MVLKLLIVVAAGYLLGNLNGAIIISRLVQHDDVRRHGSGNAGLTNFVRNYGGLASLLVLLIDAAKAATACLLGCWLVPEYPLEGGALAALAVGLGHDFPALLGFHGGKGIVCGFAAVVVLDWRVGLAAFVVFAIVYLIGGYVSLSSVSAALTVGVSFACLHWSQPWAVGLCTALCLLAVFMHRGNLVRLIRGTEPRTSLFKKEKKQ